MGIAMFIGIDIGGTNIKGVLVDKDGNIINFKKVLTSGSSKEIEDEICQLIEYLITSRSISKNSIKAIGIGAPGSIDRKKGIIITSPNIKSWKRYPIVKRIEERIGIRVFLENDATSAVVGEWWKGNGMNFRSWIMLTLGTGIGGGAIIDNKLYTGQSGSSMEFGHTSIDYKGRRCSCGNRGCLEIYASATALVRFTKSGLRDYVKSSIHSRINREELTAKLIYEEALKGDDLARIVFNKVSTFLGIGIANLVNIFNPAAVILGGGLSRAYKVMLPVVKGVVSDRALNGLKEDVKYLIVKEEEKIPAQGAAKLAMDGYSKLE